VTEVYKFAVFMFWMCVFLIGISLAVGDAEARPTTWHKSEASYYTLYGNRTACGVIMSDRAWHVASLVREHARCGRRITICNRQRCVRVRVMDRGAFRSDGRVWDLTPRVKRALRCNDLCHVRWRRYW
jgi:hypothetical protein